MNKVKVGLVGCGPMGMGLATAAAKTLAEITAVADVDSERARVAAEKFGCARFADMEALLKKADVEAVIVATPPFQHRADVVAAAQAGKHVFCEKPMSLTVEDCRQMIEACEKAGVKLMVGQILRYYPAFAKMKEVVDSGELGEPMAVCTTRLQNCTADIWNRGWRTKKADSGGTLLEINAHEFDYMCYVLGQPVAVFARTAKFIASKRDYEDLVLTTVELEGGGVGSLRSGICASSDLYMVEILCSEGTASLENWRTVSWGRFGEAAKQLSTDEIQMEPPSERETREFLQAIRDDTPVPIPGQHGMRAVALACAAYESAATRSLVRLE